MSFPRFEGSFLGDETRLHPAALLECKICWHVYDPAEGCDYWQVPPGTPFAALPDHWRCPRCDGARDQFMVIGEMSPAPLPAAVPAVRVDPLPALAVAAAARFEATFREIHVGQMRGVPLVNETLEVRSIGFRPWQGRVIGIVLTPWFMNIVLVPGPEEDWSGLVPGRRELIDFPSGEYEFIAANRPETGPYKACSLFSPMFDFSSMLQAEETARAAIAALFDATIRDDEVKPESPPQGPAPAVGGTRRMEPSRRALIFGGLPATAGSAGS